MVQYTILFDLHGIVLLATLIACQSALKKKKWKKKKEKNVHNSSSEIKLLEDI